MTVKDMIEMLQTIDPCSEVESWDPNTNAWESVTGCTHSGKDNKVQLYTDEP